MDLVGRAVLALPEQRVSFYWLGGLPGTALSCPKADSFYEES